MRAAPAMRERVGGLDVVRFCAALMVVIYHLSFIEWLSPHSLGARLFERQAPIPALVHWSWSGWIGVQVFFVISGFVIAFSSAGVSPRSFVRGRVLRLWPASAIASTLSLSLFLAYQPLPPGLTALRYLKELLFIPIGPWLNGVVWTLGVELVFYALVLALLRLGREAAIERLATALALWSFAYHAILWTPDGLLEPLKWVLTRFPRVNELMLLNHGAFFALGILYFLYHRRRLGSAHLGTALVALLACVMQIARTYVWETTEYRTFGIVVQTSILLPLAAWFGSLLLIGVFIRRSRAGRDSLAGMQSIARLGSMTYPLYLVHTWVGLLAILALRQAGLPAPLEVAIAVSAALVVAWVVNDWLEPGVRRVTALAFDHVLPERATP